MILSQFFFLLHFHDMAQIVLTTEYEWIESEQI